MRPLSRDWIAWSLLLGIAFVAVTEFYVRQQTGMSTAQYIEKIVVIGQRPSH